VTDLGGRRARSSYVRSLVLVALALAGCAEPLEPVDPPEAAEPRPAIFVPPTHRDGDRVVMPLAFPDGTRVTIAYPPELAIAELGVQPYGSATLASRRVARDFLILYGAGRETHVPNALRFEFGRWTVEVYDYPSGPAAMTDAERRTFQASLHGRETADGFLILDATPPLTLAQANETAGPALEFGHTRDSPWLRLALVKCGPNAESTSPDFASWCLSDSVVAHAYGGRRFLAAAAEGIELR
jgi:hypothetical protein